MDNRTTATARARRKKRIQRRKKLNFRENMNKKLVSLFLLVALVFVGLFARMGYIYRVKGETYKKQILSQQQYDSKTLPFRRGEILDANGTKLAYSEKVYNLVLDVKSIREEDEKKENVMSETLSNLQKYFSVNPSDVTDYMKDKPNSQYWVVQKTLSYDQIQPFLEAKAENDLITGVWFEEEYRRQYPYSTMASSVIGFSGSANNGLCGLEKHYDTLLNGTPGREYGYLTEDSELERTTIAATDGNSLVTSIDINIQSVVEKYMKQFNDEHRGEYREGEEGASNMGVIVMNPKTGEIMAMADSPNFDLNNPWDLSPFYTQESIAAMDDEEQKKALNKIWRNFCISDTYEPGSVAKAMTIAAGIDSGKIVGNEHYFCDGVREVGGHKIKCHKHVGHGDVDVSQALEQSCNVALMYMGDQIGKEEFMKYLYNFNIGLKTNIDLAGEARTSSLVFNVENMVSSDLAISTFGQGFNVSMIQMASAFCSIINGGKYFEPHVVTEIRSQDGTVVKKIEPRVLKQTVSATTSDTMRTYLANVCSLGTGKKAVPAGYLIGGKTGTAEKAPRGTGNYVVSFMGFAPIDDPQVVVYVVIDEPNVADQPHSDFAQGIAKNVFTEILPYLNVFRTEELSEEEIAELEALHILKTEGGQEEGEGQAGEGFYENDDPDGLGAEDTLVIGGENKPQEEQQISVDSETGYAIDPISGEYLNPQTYEPVDPTSSDLDDLTGASLNPVEEDDEETFETYQAIDKEKESRGFTAGAGFF